MLRAVNICEFSLLLIRDIQSHGARKKEVDEFMGESDEEDSDYEGGEESEVRVVLMEDHVLK